MTAERRAGGEVRVAGRTLSGVAMPYGTISPDFRERFEPGAFGPVAAIDCNLQHDANTVLVRGASLTDSPEALRVSATLPEGAAALALVRRRALNGFSVEFRARREHRDAAGVRVVEAADLTGLALVDRPAYPASGAEVRARSGRTFRQRIPSGQNLGCACSGAACKFAKFTGEAINEAFSEAWDEAAEILAVRGGYGSPLASKSRGTLRAAMSGDDAVVEIDLPTGDAGAAVLADIENAGAAVLARPYLDADASEGAIESRRAEADGDVMAYTRIRVRSIVVGATDQVEGWPAPEVVPTPDEFMPAARATPAWRRWWL